MSVLHLGYIEQDTLANLQAIESANNLVSKQWYWDTTNNRAYYAESVSSLIGPIEPGGLVSSFSDSNNIEHTDNGSGDFSFDVVIDPAADNVLETSASGLKVPDISIAAASQDYLNYDSGTRELSVKQLLVVSVTVDNSAADLATWIASNYTQGDEKQEGDLLVLTDPDPTEVWIHNGGTAGTAADFTKVNTGSINDAYIRTLFSAGDSLAYNNTTGEFSLALSTDSGNALSLGTDDNIFLSETFMNTASDIGSGSMDFGQNLRLSGSGLISTSFSQIGSDSTFSININTTTAQSGDIMRYNGSAIVWEAPATPGDPDQTLSVGSGNLTISGSGGNSVDLDLINYWQKDLTDHLFYTAGNIRIGSDSQQRGLTIYSNATSNQAITLDHYGADLNNNKSEIKWSHQGTRRYSIGLDGEDIDQGGGYYGGNDFTIRSYQPDGTTVLNTIFKYLRSSDSLVPGSRIGLFTNSPLHAKVDIAGDLRVRTITQDNALESVLVRDANGVIKRRAIGTFPGATGSTNIYNTSGALDGNRNLDLDTFTLTMRNNADANVVQFSESGSTINAILGDIEVTTAEAGLILKSQNGTRYRLTVTNYGALEATSI